MIKLKIFVFLLIILSFSAEAKYVRQLKEPEFFIPEKNKMHQPEKLPELKTIKKESIKDSTKEEIYAETPEYKKKYAEYVRDINIFIEKGTMPENEVLNRDLQAMENGEIFEITENAPAQIKTQEHKNFEKLVQKQLKN